MQFVILTAQCGRSLQPLYQYQVDKVYQVDYDDYNYDVVFCYLIFNRIVAYIRL